MAIDPRTELTPPQIAPAPPERDQTDLPDPRAGDEARAFATDEERPVEADEGRRPQADFGAPISLGREEADDAQSEGEVASRLTGSDEAAERRLREQRVERPLTRRIHQGMPSYSEPDPQIAGVVGRVARDAEGRSDLDDTQTRAPTDEAT